MFMKGFTKWSAFALTGLMAMLLSSCVTHRYPRPHRHHPHRHKVVIVAEQITDFEQGKDCTIAEECLALTERISYDSTE